MYRPALLALLFALLPLGAWGQTVIDLQSGHVRGKTVEDYRLEQGVAARAKADSLAYVDRLTRALNALSADSLAQAETLLREALRLRPEAPGNYLVQQHLGDIAFSRGDLGAAATRYTAALRLRPDLYAVRYRRAVCYSEAGSLDAALDDTDALLLIAPSDSARCDVHFLRAAIRLRAKRPDAARAELESLLTLQPDHRAAQLLLCSVYEDLGQPREAMRRLDDYLRLYPDDRDAQAARAALQHKRVSR